MRFNHAREGGGAIFYVCDGDCGHAYVRIFKSTLHDNPSAGFSTAAIPASSTTPPAARLTPS